MKQRIESTCQLTLALIGPGKEMLHFINQKNFRGSCCARQAVVLVLSILILATPVLAQRSRQVVVPDLTGGDTVPKGWTHDWTLGPTGARGWIFSDKHVTTDARQILITEVERGSPADGMLRVGDVIIGTGDRKFDGDARILFGRAITEAERKVNRGRLKLKCWRRGKSRSLTIKLQTLPDYGTTTPFG